METARPTFAEAFRFWVKLGCISFGGPAGQIAIMHAELVEKRRWVGEERFLHALNYCMLLPGPEAQQLAIYLGWLLHRTWGGIVAGVFFVLPSAVLLWALSWLYVSFGAQAWMVGVFSGLKPAVLAIVAVAALRIGGKVLKNAAMWALAVSAFAAIYFLNAPFPFIVLGAGVLGWLGGKWRPGMFAVLKGHGGKVSDAEFPATEASTVKPTLGRALRVCVLCLVLWWTPVLLAGWWLGWAHAIPQEGLFFSKAAMVTFGGAYAVLPYVSQQAVGHGWLSAPQMLDGLGLAETTPGPLIMVLQFVGFLGGWNFPGPLPPLLAATLGAAITTWTTFVPCFLWIFLGAPHIERLRENRALIAALSAITAAVAGVIFNLALWFGVAVLFPKGGPVNGFGIVLAIVAFVGMQRWKWGVRPVVLASGALGALKMWLGW